MKVSRILIILLFGISILPFSHNSIFHGGRISLSASDSTFSSGGELNQLRYDLSQTYSSHSPIYIYNDGDLSSASINPSSTGAIDDPYILEGWNISYIHIQDTTKYFILQDCWFNSSSPIGVYIRNSAVGTCNIRNNFFHSFGSSIDIANSNSAKITNNTCIDANLYGGIIAEGCSNISIMNNECIDGEYGIYFSSCSYSLISDNTCFNNSLGGIRDAGASLSTTIFNNTCYKNAYGILTSSSFCILHNNTSYENNNAAGIDNQGTYNIIEKNQCYQNYIFILS